MGNLEFFLFSLLSDFFLFGEYFVRSRLHHMCLSNENRKNDGIPREIFFLNTKLVEPM
jgi:hypothetical protein